MPPLIPNRLSRLPSTICTNHSYLNGQITRCFSSTPQVNARAGRNKSPRVTRLRRQMNLWLNTRGVPFRDPKPGTFNYLGAYTQNGQFRGSENPEHKDSFEFLPFPRNNTFASQPVASDELREAVWSKVMKDGLSVSHVSAELGVEMNRVGAIVRLKEIEKEWIRKRIPLARAYQKAVLGMLPQTPYPLPPGGKVHESINDLPVHRATGTQIWHPTSESREFTRLDAAKIFEDGLKPADERVPHPELHIMEKDRIAGIPQEEREVLAQQRIDEAEALKAKQQARKATWEKHNVQVIPKTRWDFKFTNISVEDAGPTGRGHRGVGARYGVPHEDRKRGQVKLPTRVD